MIGLLVTYFVVAYLLVPSGIFRICYSISLPRIIKFQRTRIEEFTFAILASILPFFLALLLTWTICTAPFSVTGSSAVRRAAYRTFISTAISDKSMGEGEQQEVFWNATNQVIRRQGRFLFWYYILVSLEAFGFARLTANYGLWRTSLSGWRKASYLWLAEKILLPAVSEWHVLLTPFAYPPEPRRQVWVDVLTTLDVLYKGRVGSHFLDKEGELSGIFLEAPRRFDREGYLREAQRSSTRLQNRDSYWRDIPSNNLYIPADKITNLNVRYLTEDEAIAIGASHRLRAEGVDAYVEPADELLDPILLSLANLYESGAKNRSQTILPSSEKERFPLREFLTEQVAEGLLERPSSDNYRLTSKGYTTYLPRIRALRRLA